MVSMAVLDSLSGCNPRRQFWQQEFLLEHLDEDIIQRDLGLVPAPREISTLSGGKAFFCPVAEAHINM
jgi:hypothetical protein